MSKKRQSATWQEVEKECILIKNLIQRLPEDEKAIAAERFCFESALWGGCCQYSSIGILESAKMDLIESAKEVMNEESDE
jgi:hypothetical protein